MCSCLRVTTCITQLPALPHPSWCPASHLMALLNGDRSGLPPVKMVASLHTTQQLKHTSSTAITLRPTGCGWQQATQQTQAHTHTT